MRTESTALSPNRNTKTPDDSAHFFRLGQELIKSSLIQVANIECNIEVRPDLSTRSFCCREKLMKLTPAAALKTFGNVGHDRNRRSLNLS